MDVYKKKFKQKRKAFNCIPVVERANEYEPYHFHALVDKPAKLSDDEFRDILKKHWKFGEVDLKRDLQGKYLNYITKLATKELQKYTFTESLLLNSLVLDNKLLNSI